MTHDDMTDYGTTGIALPSGLDRPIAAGEFSVPNDLLLEENQLVWSWLNGRRQVRPGPGLLDQFVQLADAPAERILAYAQRWGLLMLCEKHRLPDSHNPQPFLDMPESGVVTWCLPPSRVADHKSWEMIDNWWHFARQARALLRIAVQLHRRHTGAPVDWSTVYEWVDDIDGPGRQGNLADERRALAYWVDEWLMWGNVRPAFHWDRRPNAVPTITLGGEGLFAALAVQLALAISRTDGLALCSSCGAPYVPERRPHPEKRRYCPACRDAGRPMRDAARDYRSRKAYRTPANDGATRLEPKRGAVSRRE